MAACLVCRSRKIRCDATRPQCRACERLGVQCPGYEREHGNVSRRELLETVQTIYHASGVEQRRVGACRPCRISKHRCSRTRPVCRRCVARNLECVYGSSKHSSSEMASAPSPSEPPSPRLPQTSLTLTTLAEDAVMQSRLVTTYFDRIHPLRCLAFLHKPSFMYSLDRGTLSQDYEKSLLLIIYALGASQLFFDSLHTSSPNLDTPAYQELADRARTEVLARVHNPTAQQLMAMALLCEYASRTDQHAMAFVLAGCIFRGLRLLGFDSPPEDGNEALVPPDRGAQNRLIWACYCVDVLLASGVDRNSSWRGDIPRIPLPCSDGDFLAQTAAKPIYLAVALESPSVIHQLDLPALTTIMIHLRTRVLRTIRAPTVRGNVWDSSSPFMVLVQELESFYNNLPVRYGLTELNMYIHRDHHVLGAVYCLHLLYHAAICDLTRVSLPGFNFPLASAFIDASADFSAQCQHRCRFHAEAISSLVQQSKGHTLIAFDDPLCSEAIFESTKIQIICSAVMPDASGSLHTTKDNIRSNMALLDTLSRGRKRPSPHIRALLPLCMVFGYGDLAEEWQDSETLRCDVLAEVTGPPDVHHLSNIAPFRRARSETRVHQSTNSPRTMTSGESPEGTQGYSNRERPPIISGSTMNSDHRQTASLGSLGVLGSPGHVAPESIAQQPILHQASIMQTPLQDYSKTAEEMSQFLTWDAAEWWNFAAQSNF